MPVPPASRKPVREGGFSPADRPDSKPVRPEIRLRKRLSQIKRPAPVHRTFSIFAFGCCLVLPWTVASVRAAQLSQLNRTNLLQFISESGAVSPVRSIGDWDKRRAAIVEAMHKVLGPLPGPDRRVPLDVRTEDEVDCETFVRRSISYQSEPDSRVPAYLLIPKKALAGAACPAVLCLHQTHALGYKVVAGLGNSPNDEYGVELARRGYVCLAPAYPLLAQYAPDLNHLGYQSGTMKAVWDNTRGLDLLESLPFVRKQSFGAIGHSLGGHNSVFTAVFDPRLKVVISSCGLDMFRDYMGGQIKGWTSTRYMPKLLEYSSDTVPFDFAELIGALAPRVCFISAPLGDSNFKWWSVDALTAAARPIYQLYGVPEHLAVEHPDCGHLFPAAMRERAYQLLDKNLLQERK